MGQKVHPYGFRLGYTKPWKSRWFVEKDYAKLLHEDVKLKNELKDKLKSAGVSSIEIERPGNKIRIIIKTARPGIIIGRKGAEIDKLKADLQKRTSREVFVDIQEVHKPELDAQLVWERNRALGVVPAGAVAAAHTARRHRLRLHRSADDLWRDWRQVLGLQGRNPPAEKARATSGHGRILESRRKKGFAKS